MKKRLNKMINANRHYDNAQKWWSIKFWDKYDYNYSWYQLDWWINNYEQMADLVTRLVMMGSTRYLIPALYRHVLARLHNFLWINERLNKLINWIDNKQIKQIRQYMIW